jgi:hypothetical protein
MPLPWAKLILFTPQIIELSRELLKRARAKPQAPGTALVAVEPDDFAQRITALEENERRQAELVERMAVQQAELTQAVLTLHRRQRGLIAAVVILGVLLAWQIFSR